MTHPSDKSSVDFGYEKVPREEKQSRVRGVFDSVAGNYDLMNDLMSAGLHRTWKAFALSLTNLRPGQLALDVAGGTGDLALGMSKQVGERGLVVLSDINAEMLGRGRDRLIDAGVVRGVDFVLADAEKLPFAPGTFDCVTIGFGLRNVTDKPAALSAMQKVLKPGGQLLIHETDTTATSSFTLQVYLGGKSIAEHNNVAGITYTTPTGWAAIQASDAPAVAL